MTFWQVLEAARWRYPIVLASIALAVGAAYGLTRMQPPQYTSTVAVLVDVTDSIRQDERLSRNEPSQAYIATQLDIIRSPAVAERVVERLDLVNDPYFASLTSAEQRVPLERRIREIVAGGMAAMPSRESQVVEIRFTSTDSQFSAKVANGFADAYLSLVLEMSVEPARREAEWFGEQRRDIRQWVEDARNRLSGYQQEMGILTSDERLDIETAKLQELASQEVAAQTALSQAVALAEAVERHVESGGDVLALADAAASPVYTSLKDRLAQQDAAIAELAATLGERHPKLVRARVEREEIVDRLEKEVLEIRAALRRDADVALANHAALREELDRQRAHVLELNRVKDKIPTLRRDVENAEQAYRLALEHFSVATLESRLQNVNASVLHRAEPALRPSSPSLRTNLAAAAFVGTFVGLVAVLLLEWVRPRVRTERTLRNLAIPYLGAVD